MARGEQGGDILNSSAASYELTETQRHAHTFTMRNVMLSLALLLGCSDGSGFVAVPDADPAAASTGFARGRQVETGGQGGNSQPRPSQDAQASDSRVVVADALPVQPDTFAAPPDTLLPDTGPYVPPVTFTPGSEVTDPALMTCPPTKGNSLGIGKPCVLGQELDCPTGTACQCGSKDNTRSLLPKDMPCMCLWHNWAGPTSVTATCDSCGEGAGCCVIRGEKFVDRTCLPNSCFFDCRGSW